MKRFVGLLSVIVLLAACHRPVETRHGTSLPLALTAIDTLMQTRPDSALTLLLEAPVDDPYYQLLLSEALYKNDSTQLNRKELLDAMAYYDSVGCPLLAARCHYMNGVGYYEMDSVVPACEEYLKALEIMEDHFDEKDLVGYNAKFMALTYTHMAVLFSDQYLHEQAIYLGKMSLLYYDKYDAEPWHVAWMLEKIGLHYFMMEQCDSAAVYFDKAIEVLPDTNNLTYRDISAGQLLLSYRQGSASQKIQERFRCLLNQAENKQEYLARCLNIGSIFYREMLYDSALFYLTKVFSESSDTSIKKQAAEWLSKICKIKGVEADIYQFAEFLAPFANQEEDNSTTKSKLTLLYNAFAKQILEREHQEAKKKNKRQAVMIVTGLLSMTLVFALLFRDKRKRLRSLKHEIDEKRSLKDKNYRLDQLLNETICQEIVHSVQGKYIKRSAVSRDFPELVLSDLQLQQLALTVNRYFGEFANQLEQHGITSNPNIVNLCHLYLLGIDEKQAAVLLDKDYTTIKRYERKLKNTFGTQESMFAVIKKMAFDY